MQKPVWRMNTGKGVPSDLGERSLYSDGLLRRNHLPKPDDFKFYGFVDIYAYQTNRTKTAKYRIKN